MGFAEGAQPALNQRRVGQHPPVQGGVIDLQAALQEQLLDVTVAQGIAQIPRDGLQDQGRLKVPALEIVLRPALQLLDKGVQDHGPPPTTEVLMPLASSTRGKRQKLCDMCGRPLWRKKNFLDWCSARSGADMCAAFDAAHTPQARMGVRGSGPNQSHALAAPVAKLVFLIPSQ